MGRFNYGWVVVLLVVVFQAATLGYMGFSFTFWVEPWSEAFGVPVTQIMVISTVMMLVMGICSMLAGRFLDRYPMNWVVAIGLFVYAGGLWLGSMAQSFVQIFLCYALMLPFATALTGTLASQTLAVKWFRGHKHMGLAIGIAAMGVSVGGMTIPPLVAEGIVEHDWRWVFKVSAVILALGLAPVMFFLLMPQPQAPDAPSESTDAGTASAVRAIPLLTLFSNRYFLIPAAAFFLDSIAYLAFQYNAASYMKSAGLSVKDTAAVISVLAGMMLASKLIVGKLTDYLHYSTVFILAALCNCVALLIFSLAIKDLMLVGAVFLGLGAGGLIPLQAKIISTHFSANHFAQVFGFFVFFPIAAIVGAPLLSLLRDYLGSYQAPLMIMVGFVVAALLLMVSLKRRDREAPEREP